MFKESKNLDIIKCGICMEKYHPNIIDKKPIVLKCGHTFCSKCLHTIYNDKNEKAACPLCLTLFGDVKNLSTNNFSLLQFLENYCATCEKEVDEKSFNCSDCCLKICDECIPDHFDKFKEKLNKNVNDISERMADWQNNSINLRNFVTSDVEITKNYIKTNVENMKCQEKSKIKDILKSFVEEHSLIKVKIDKENDIIIETLNKLNTFSSKLKELSFNFDERISIFSQMSEINSELKQINNYKPVDLNDKISIIGNEYNVENPIIIHSKTWMKYMLQTQSLNDHYDPNKFLEYLINDLNGKNTKVNLSIGIIGRAKSGKSSFINAFFNLRSDDPLYVKTDYVECTMGPKLYNYKKNNFENVEIWDTPGVGTQTFKLENHKNIIEHINCNVYIYLYDTQFNSVDKQVAEIIKKMNKPLFICRTKVDSDFKARVEKKEKKYFKKLDTEIRNKYLNVEMNEYKGVFKDIREAFEKDRITNNAFLKNEERVFYLSNEQQYRDLFEFNLFIEELLKLLPKFKANLVIDLVRTKSKELLKQKKQLILNEIKPIVHSYICYAGFDSLDEFKRFLNVQMQEYARRLGLNEIFKEIENKDFENLLQSIENDFPIKFDSIRNKNKFTSSNSTIIGFKTKFMFSFRNFGAKNALVENTCNFLKENLEIIFIKTNEIFENNLISRYN